jgi:NAD(P)-dependent dehydrogenase (short-subunit alcohol dehydrogenase family)
MSGALEEATSVDSIRLDGKVAIVTGGARGIGQAIACTLSQAGATTVVGDAHGGHLVHPLRRAIRVWRPVYSA